MASDHVEHGGLLIHRDYLDALRAAGLGSFDALLAVSGDANLNKKGLATWRQRIPLRVGEHELFLKRYTRPPVKEQVSQRLRGFTGTAQMEFHWLRRVGALGIAAPTAVAFGLRKRGLVEAQSVLLTAKVPGISLEKWVPANVELKLNDRVFKQNLLAAVAEMTAKLHRAGLFHRDLYLAHLFIDDSGSQPQLSMIDLHRVIRPRLFARRWLIKDLASLNYSTPKVAASRADRLRWFKQYRGINRLMAADRSLIRSIVAKTTRIARHSTKHRLG